MARKTIAQLREMEVDKLAHMKSAEPSEADYSEARRLMNSFYRLCGLCETNLYLANDERRHDSPYTKESEERETKWHKRLDAEFNRLYGLRLVYCGYAPSIGIIHENNGGFSERVNRWFYE